MKNNHLCEIIERMKKIVLIGAGGLAAEIIETINGINCYSPEEKYEIQGLVVEDQYYQEGMSCIGYPVVGTLGWLLDRKNEFVAICAVGIPSERARIQKDLMSKGIIFESVIAAGVYVSPTSVIGRGAYLAHGCVVSTKCTIGDGVLLNGGVIVGHDTTIGSYTCIMTRSDVGGRCSVGEEILVGAHAYIIPDRKIGDKSTIAAGSVVFSNVKSGTTVLGNPAKRLKCLE